MKLPILNQHGSRSLTEAITGTARVDPLTKSLVRRLRRGEIAIIAHEDIDELSARALVKCRPAAVLNALDSTTGQYKNLGPHVLLDADIPLIDCLGRQIMEIANDGCQVTVKGADVLLDGASVAGRIVSRPTLEAKQHLAQQNLHERLTDFVENTLHYIRNEEHLLYDSPELPPLETRIEGRHCVVAVRGRQYEADLRTSATYISEEKPALIAVDGAADTMLANGLRPDIIFGDMDSISDEALRCGAEIVVHAYSDGRALGLKRIASLGLESKLFRCPGTSEDAALLLAFHSGADLIVAIGTHSSMDDFLDKGRNGMASSFLTRLRTSSHLVDARGVNMLYRSQPKVRHLIWLALAGLFVVSAIAGSSEFVRQFLELISIKLQLTFRALLRALPF